ncbi:phage minor capsid protein [Anaeromicrobium sediminis]|uniref:Minor capsid protein n=1 Tax=Anaeromicrobium sediminis TaxID=1478221 RepID=A0A267MQZ0_9FIRM|nr:phage minor capsid protein [Anaeromicrobium sediminis]PAB61328.1 hypothetical protein CCE28_02535 [Anaeromicrobium sediminis]
MDEALKILTETTQEALVELYEKMNALASGGNMNKAKRIYRQMQIITVELGKFYDDFSAAAVEAEYLKGFDLEGMDLSFIDTGEFKAKITDKTFTGLHMESIDALTTALQQNLSMAIANLNIQVGRMAKDKFAEITKKQALKGMLKGSTRKDISKNVVERLTQEGFIVFKDKLGRNWRLDSYAEMNMRSTLREANTRGIENRAIQEGYDLLKVSEHGVTCEKCAKVEGRVFSISGNNANYPKWDNHIIKHTHPNCRHTVSIFQEKYYDGDVEELRKKSNSSTDYRTDAQKEKYQGMQQKKVKKRQNKLQYERYKARLGKNAPKSLSGFIQVKKSKNWSNLKKKYKEAGR